MSPKWDKYMVFIGLFYRCLILFDRRSYISWWMVLFYFPSYFVWGSRFRFCNGFWLH